MDELIQLTAHLGALKPEDVEMVNSYVSTPPVPGRSGLAAYLQDRPQGFVQFTKQTHTAGELPGMTRVNVELIVIHSEPAGSQTLEARTVEAIQGGWLAQTGWTVTERQSAREDRATFTRLTATTQVPADLISTLEETL